MRIRLFCPTCATPGRLQLPGPRGWTCPACEHAVELAPSAGDPALPCCAACGCEELYRKKDFPHGLGMTILVGAFIASTITYGLYDKVLTWVILLGSFAFDGILYLLVKDVIVCYRCNAEHRGVPHTERFAPFELTIGERYRQERIRREEMRK